MTDPTTPSPDEAPDQAQLPGAEGPSSDVPDSLAAEEPAAPSDAVTPPVPDEEIPGEQGDQAPVLDSFAAEEPVQEPAPEHDAPPVDQVEPPVHEPLPVEQPAEPAPVEQPAEPAPVEEPEPELEPVSVVPAPLPVPAEESTSDEGAVDDAPPVGTRRSRAWIPMTAVAVTVALLAAGTGWLAGQLRQQDQAQSARAEAVAAARDAARLLFSYDHTKLEQDFAAGVAVTTGEFRDQYRRTTKEVVTPVAEQYKAVVVAEVVEAAVIEAGASEVVALVFLNQATTSTRVQGQQVDQSRVRMRLVERDGRWLVEEVKAL